MPYIEGSSNAFAVNAFSSAETLLTVECGVSAEVGDGGANGRVKVFASSEADAVGEYDSVPLVIKLPFASEEHYA